MTLFIISFIVMIMVVLALSVRVLFGKPAIKGSCRATDHLPGFEADACSGACGRKKNIDCDAQGHRCRRSRHGHEPV